MTDIAAGGLHSLSLDSTGQVWSWGANDAGQLGQAAGAPGKVAAPANAGVVAIAAGWKHSLAIGPGGAVLAWGSNASGQLGDGTKIPRAAPVGALAPCNAGVSLIAAGYAHSLCV
jgi:alpha-tubulin suppressor-like RCC1 family protein